MIHYLIDGNNLFGKAKALTSFSKKKIGNEREQLVHLLDRFFYGRNCKVFLYFDGFQKIAIRSHKMKIIYSNSEPADTIIKSDISQSKNPKNLYVISSDLEIFDFARACCCHVKTSDEFYKDMDNKLTIELEEKPEPSSAELDYFKHLFENDNE
jgi:predicted RNA-binding protein with PIN domain